MADDLQGNLQNYQLQLKQVEAALLIDPTNDELVKLKTDLDEVIELTTDLIRSQLLEAAGTSTEQEVTPVAVQSSSRSTGGGKKDWKVGDKCMAIWSEDGQYYEATIDEITEDKEEVSVIFEAYKNADVTTLSLLREFTPSDKSKEGSDKKGKHGMTRQREYQKKKKQKKLARFKELEEERETEKNKWLAFATKKKGGVSKKSIFASPESVTGRVGIGTCGIGGKPMTEFTSAEKWRKGV